MEATHDSTSGPQTPPHAPWDASPPSHEPAPPAWAHKGFATELEWRQNNMLEFIDAISQEGTQRISAVLTAALHVLEADPLGDPFTLRELLMTARRTAQDMQENINDNAAGLGAGYDDLRLNAFRDRVWKARDQLRNSRPIMPA